MIFHPSCKGIGVAMPKAIRRFAFNLCAMLISLLLWLGWEGGLTAWAAASLDPAHQPLVEVNISLGNAANELKFVPDRLNFQAGQRYKLILTNPSNQKHYFTAKDFADSLWTQKVEAGKAEFKGAIHEVELKPGGQAEWVFLPMKAGQYELHCSILGHTEAGMVGALTVDSAL